MLTSMRSSAEPPTNLNPHYRGRVRTGCLTCRASKVRCDELRPTCRRCSRLGKACVYKSKAEAIGAREQHIDSPSIHPPGENFSYEDVDSVASTGQLQNPSCSVSASFHWLESPNAEGTDWSTNDTVWTNGSRTSIIDSPATLLFMTSQDIYLCTTIDRLAADEAQNTPSFTNFLQEARIPILSAFDQVNWQQFKVHLAKLATYHKTVAASVLALQSLLNALTNGIPISRTIDDAYRAATASFHSLVDDKDEDFDTMLAISLLLCLYSMLALGDTESCLRHVGSNSGFVRRLEHWLSIDGRSPISLRISAWHILLHAAGRRGGNPGTLSSLVLHRLRAIDVAKPSLIQDTSHDSSISLFDYVTAPIFEFYLALQKLSAEVAETSHYHRSRITVEDQKEVAELMFDIKARLHRLWEARPTLMKLDADSIRAHLSPQIANSIITFMGLCLAAYHSEIVEIGRTLSDPPLASDEAKNAMREIRNIVDGPWDAFAEDGRLNAGYLRPLFLCAIESMNDQDVQWAIKRLRQIRDPVCRSDFFASFAEGLTAAQIAKGRRVTTKFFCRQKFGMSPPFL